MRPAWQSELTTVSEQLSPFCPSCPPPLSATHCRPPLQIWPEGQFALVRQPDAQTPPLPLAKEQYSVSGHCAAEHSASEVQVSPVPWGMQRPSAVQVSVAGLQVTPPLLQLGASHPAGVASRLQ